MNSGVERKLAVFDIDGTLTNSVLIHQDAFFKSLHEMGVQNFDTNWGGYKHHTDSFIFKSIVETQYKRGIYYKDLEQFEECLLKNILSSTVDESIKEINGASSFLKSLDSFGFDLVFATGSLLRPALLKLDQATIPHSVELVIAANQIYSREELVSSAIKRAEQFYSRNSYKEVISFGDGLWDFETAKNLNIDFIGIGNKRFLEFGVIHYYNDFMEIINSFPRIEKLRV